MKFTCTKENLAKGLLLVGSLTAKSTNLPILGNVLITANESGVEFVTTNLELAISSSIRAKVDEPGSFTVPVKMLSDYIALLPDGQIELEVQENELQISCHGTSTKIKGSPSDEFPVIPKIEDGEIYMVDSGKLKSAISDVAFSVAKNDIRPELAGIQVDISYENEDGMTLASTDSYRLSQRKVELLQGQEAKSFIVPSKTAQEFIRLLGVVGGKVLGDEEVHTHLQVNETQIALRSEVFEVVSRLIDGKYPDYRQIIPASFATKVTLSKEIITKHIKAASLFTLTGTNAVKIEISAKEKQISLSSASAQTGAHESTMDVEVEGNDTSIVLNHRYLLDGLSHMPEGDIEIMLNGSDSPSLLRSKQHPQFLYIVMPIRQ